jgi:hypothetical protein
MTIAQDVAGFLLTSNSMIRSRFGRIGFWIDAFHVDAAGLRDVGTAISNGWIEVRVGGTGSLLAAAYGPHNDRMTVRSNDVHRTLLGQSAIVHESVHAMNDMRRVRTTVLKDETSGYLAEAIYMMAAHIWPASSTRADTLAIYGAARALIDAQMLAYRQGVRLTSTHYQALLDAIHRHQAYSGISESQATSGLGAESGETIFTAAAAGSGAPRHGPSPAPVLKPTESPASPILSPVQRTTDSPIRPASPL